MGKSRPMLLIVGGGSNSEKTDTSHRGDITEAEVTAALVRAGLRLLRPLSAAGRYDLLIDRGNGAFMRVQCKTGVVKDGSVVFRISSGGVYCPATHEVYLVPMNAVVAP